MKALKLPFAFWSSDMLNTTTFENVPGPSTTPLVTSTLPSISRGPAQTVRGGLLT